MKVHRLQLKAAFMGNKRIYRILEMDERQTFEDLSDLILKAFDFDSDHLYMFSLNRKRYDPEGIYYPMSAEGKKADRVKLQAAKLQEKDKFLYLYDFGDEWQFELTVLKRMESEQLQSPQVIKGKGELCQYPDWEDEDWEEDMDEEHPGLFVYQTKETDSAIEAMLQGLPALLQQMWTRLIKDELSAVDAEDMTFLYRLKERGLVELEETENSLYIEVKQGTKERPSSYRALKGLSKRSDIERQLLALIGVYGVVEQEELYHLYCENTLHGAYEDGDVKTAVTQLGAFGFWNCVACENGVCYISFFCEAIVKDILQKRKEYPVRWYRPLEQHEQEALLSGDFRTVPGIYGETFHKLFWNYGWNPMDAETFLEELIKCVAVGYSEEDYIRQADEALKENQISMSGELRKQLFKFRKGMPSATLKGYTWGEYEETRKDGYHQLSLFEEELPFQ